MERDRPQCPLDAETVTAIARLNPNTILTIQVRAGDLAKAFEEVEGGPTELTPGQAAKRYGRSAKYWRAKAEGGAITGAYRDPETKRWYLPRDECRAHLHGKAAGPPGSSRPFRRRGPRKRGNPGS